MKAWVSLFLFLMFTHTDLKAEAITIAYQDLDGLLRKNSTLIHSSIESVNAAEVQVGSMDQTYLPKAAFELGIGEQKEANGVGDTAAFWKVEIQSNLYRGGRDQMQLQLREAEVLIKKADTQALYRSELFKARTDFVQLIFIRSMKNLIASSKEDYEGLSKSIRTKVQAGLMTDTILQDFNLAKDDLERQLIHLESEEHELEDKLALVLGIPADQKLRLIMPDLDTRSRYITPPIPPQDHLPEIRKLALLAESLKSETQARNEWWRPDVDFFAAATRFELERSRDMRSLPERELSIGLRMTVNLEAKSYRDAELRSKRSEIAALNLQREHLEREIKHRLHEYTREMSTQARLIVTYEKSLGRAGDLLKRYRNEFERGVIGSEGVSTTIRDIFELRKKRIETLASYHLARAGFETLTEIESPH